MMRSVFANGLAGGMLALCIAAILGLPGTPAPVLAGAAAETGSRLRFDGLEGGTIDLDDWRGDPVLVVNTASLCGFAPQFDTLQAMHETLGPRGLHVLAVPSDDFRQELEDAAAVKSYCAARFDLTLPMTAITPVTGAGAHPFYLWLAREHGFVPGWNFNKVLIGPEGEVLGTWGAPVPPDSPAILSRIEAALR